MHGKQPTGSRKAAERIVEKIVEMVMGTGVAGEVMAKRDAWSRIPIGRDSGSMMRDQAKGFGDEVEVLESVWASCDADE